MTGPFKMKGYSYPGTSPAKIDLTKKTGKGPRATIKPKRSEEEEIEFMNVQDYQSVPTFHNVIPGPHDDVKKKLKK